jgi:hypothetical protein
MEFRWFNLSLRYLRLSSSVDDSRWGDVPEYMRIVIMRICNTAEVTYMEGAIFRSNERRAALFSSVGALNYGQSGVDSA